MMISGSSNNHKNHGQVGQEVAARSPDAPAVPDDVENGGQEVDRLPPTGLATTNHPEPKEELSANNRWSRCSTFSFTAFIFIILAAVVCVIGVALSAVSPASSKTIIASKQVAVVAAVPIDDYKQVCRSSGGCDGLCSNDLGKKYPFVRFNGVTAADVCAASCGCARGIKGVKYRGFQIYSGFCFCLMDWLDDEDAKDLKAIEKLNDEACGPAGASNYYDDDGVLTGSGKITSLNGSSGRCYKLKSKAGKSPKRD